MTYGSSTYGSRCYGEGALNSNLAELEEVVAGVNAKKVIFWIGSGLSRIAGCPSWTALIEEIFENEVMKAEGHECKHVLGKMDNPDILCFCRKEYERKKQLPIFKTLLLRASYHDTSKFKEHYLPIVKALKRITPKVPIITTNIDNCLELTGLFDCQNRRFYSLPDFLPKHIAEDTIFHIHGVVERPDTGVWTFDDYRKMYSEGTMKAFLEHVSSNYIVLFIGVGLRENVIMDYFKEQNKAKHYALVPAEEWNVTLGNLWRGFNIELINYGKRDDFGGAFMGWVNQSFKNIPAWSDEGGSSNV